MIRRKLTLKRVDPWTVLKFGFVVNLVLLLVALLAFWVIWVIIGRLGLIEQFCGSIGTIVLDLQDCGLNGGNIFKTLLFLGVLGVIVQTGIFVLFAFLYNLIADLTGGLGFTYLDDSSDAVAVGARSATTREQTRPETASGTGRAAGAAVAAGAVASSSPGGSGTAAGPSTSPDQRSAPSRPTPGGPPAGPPQRPEQSSDGEPTSARGTSPSSDRSADKTTSRRTSERQESSDERPSGSLWNDPTQVQRRE